ncbi:MAG: acyl-CoA dehydrogenase family protein [Thermodesulfobacteriota bacterium]
MDFDLREEHKMIKQMARDFTEKVIKPRAEEMDRTGAYPYDIIQQMADLGMMGIPFPEEWGGSGGDWVGMHVCIEELSRGDATLGAMVEVTSCVVGQELHVFGTEEQKRRWLIPIAEGRDIGAFGMTEPQAGSDAGAVRTAAVLDGGEWVLNGTKRFITNIGLDNSRIVIATALTSQESAGKRSISTFIVPKASPGFTLGKRHDKIAWRASATHDVILEDCRIPKDNLLGDPQRGFAQHLQVLETGRISIGAICVGVAQACLEEALSYAKERVQFGRPISKFQAIQFKLADMACAIELARNQYLKAAWLKDQGRRHTFEATVTKLFASEMLERVASDAVQIHGGYGYMEEYPVSRYYKGAKLLQIVEGTSEVQRTILSRILGC